MKVQKGKRMVVTLPKDLVTEVLVRLPVKSLMRFKCVQRSWNALFRSRTFVTRHIQGSSERHMIFRYESLDSDKPCIAMLLCDDQPPQDLEYPFANNSLIRILSYGHCNGVFCLYGYYEDFRHQLILWNPATREVKVVPPPPHKSSHDDYLHYSLLDARNILRGFGVDPCTNDFKVINLVIDYKKRLHPPSAEVYNLSTNSWTVICDNVPTTYIPPSSCTTSTLANGVYHWLIGGYFGRIGDYKDILCFDFRNNQFYKLKAPIIHHGIDYHDNLAEVNDSIAYVVYYYKSVRLEIWILNQDSWTKKYSIGPLDPMVCICGIWKDGAGFLGGKPEQSLVSYNFDGQPVHRFQVNLDLLIRIYKYVESIAPLSV